MAVGDFDSSWHLSVDDIAVDSVKDPTMLQVKIKGSKTDQLRLGAILSLWGKRVQTYAQYYQ